MTPNPSAVAWLPWAAPAFERARAHNKTILLSVVAPWSAGCREMDRLTYGDADTAAAINALCVAVRVDADLRPDLADRYDFGGLPTTAFLTASGEILGGGTFVQPDRLRDALSRLSARPPRLDVVPPPPDENAGQIDLDGLTAAVFDTFDDVHGGFGGAPRFPHTAPVRLALDLYVETADALMLERAARTLDAMGWGGLYDDEGGGFFRCAGASDWSGAQAEKVLPVNAALLDLYLYAGTVASSERWFARAVDVVRFIEGKLIAANGAWRYTECAAPARQFTDANALTASAMLHAARVFDDAALGKRAIDGLERVLLSTYRPGEGVAHSAVGVRGLLTDHVAMAAANLDAWDSTGNIVYRMMAEELMHFAVRTMWDPDDGGFCDRAAEADEGSGVPPCGRVKPFVLNCEAAVVLRRLAEALDDPLCDQRAVATLAAVRGRALAHGPQAAHYLLAQRAVLR